jgi:hypothetical protein
MQSLSAQQFPLEKPDPIFPSRLQWLCQPEQIEHTLHLLYHLNSWKKARQQLLYADRQGLSEVQAIVLQRAVHENRLEAIGYIDGSRRFPTELLLESAATNAARGVLIHIKDTCAPETWPPYWPNGSSIYQRFIRPLYRRMAGKDFRNASDAATCLDLQQISAYIQEHLQKLVERACLTRTPLSPRRLTALCIAPIDLLHIRDNRIYFLDGYDTWEDLASSDQCKLDPEGFSKIVFQYAHGQTKYLFHLPFRRAERFLAPKHIQELRHIPGETEIGMFQSKLINEKESLQHLPGEILQDLGVDITSVCPHQLVEKETYLAKPAIRDMLWPTQTHDIEDWDDDDPWDGICLPPEPM